VIHDGMTGREIFEASKAYWKEYYKNRPKNRGIVHKPKPLVNGCNCDGAGWYMLDVDPMDYRHGQLQRCECNGKGTSFRKSLQAFANDTFDTFDVNRPLAEYKTATHTMTVDFQQKRLMMAYNTLKSDVFDNGTSYYVFGNVGCGKSHLARAWAIQYAEQGYNVMYRIMPNLVDELRSAVKTNTVDRIIDQLTYADALVIDDVGAEEDQSDWIRGRIFRVIEGRMGKKTLYTSNLDPTELFNRLDERIADRINQSKRLWLPFQSYRQIIRDRGTK
jgi:DNA replication protein DnaC